MAEHSQHGLEELKSLVGKERIISQTIVTPDRGTRAISDEVRVADSITLEFLP